MELMELSSIIFASYAVLAFFDGVFLHLWKYRLYSFEDTVYEHFLHSARAVLFPFLVVGLYGYDVRGFLFIGVILVALTDLVFQGIDMWEEKMARIRFGGLSSVEYLLHTVLTSMHVSALLLYVLAKPVDSWSWHWFPVLESSFLPNFIAMNLLPGATIVAIIHLLLLLPFFRRIDKSSKLV